jgi:hypothetical protein
MNHRRTSFLLILLVGLMGLLTACGGDTATPTTPVTTATTATMAEPTATTAMAADTPTTAAMAADTPTTEVMAADTPTTGTGSGTGTGTNNATLQAATDAMKGVTSYHFTMTTDMGATGSTMAEGDMIPPDKMSMTTTASMAGQEIKTQMIKIGTDVWTNVGGQWIKTEAPVTVNPTDMMSMGNVTDLEDLGDDTVDGVASKHLRYKASTDTGTAAGATSSQAEIWIDKATNRVVQIVSSTDVAGTGTVKVTMKFSRYNDPAIKIEPPQ